MYVSNYNDSGQRNHAKNKVLDFELVEKNVPTAFTKMFFSFLVFLRSS